LRHPLYSAGKVKGKNRDRFEQEWVENGLGQ
jgi:hypothetical protein